MTELRTRESVSARALEFTVLTAARTGEVIGATWDEIDLDAKVWTIPAERMKATREHRVPLSARAVKILQSLPREGDFVFIGSRKGEGLSNMAMLELVRGMRSGVTVHGFRSTFKDWCSEETHTPNMVSEAALAHVVADKVEAAYRRGDLLAKRRKLMTEWTRYCQSEGAEVVTMKRKVTA
jgi:integrase